MGNSWGFDTFILEGFYYYNQCSKVNFMP
uniref:Uncharacterized protein n=1 Tax=Rhizophora mucronata TaxID=61149 RepID=A0A2P2PVA0_RHIMU